MVISRKRAVIFVNEYGICLITGVILLLFYTGNIINSDSCFIRSILEPRNITVLTGKIISNPVRNYSGQYYRVNITVSATEGFLPRQRENPVVVYSEASGTAVLYIPAAVVESRYPGKLYSAVEPYLIHTGSSNSSMIVECGARFRFHVRAVQSAMQKMPVYYVQAVEFIGFDNTVTGAIARFRAELRLKLKCVLYNWGPAGGLLLALLSGAGEYTDTAISEEFKYAGLAHILALSGMHLAFFAGMAAAVASGGGRIFSSAVSVAAVLFFVWFAGITPSLLRALIFFLLNMMVRLCGLKPPQIKLLCVTLLLHICIVPEHLFQLSFQLSYAALAGIFCTKEIFDKISFRIAPPVIASGISSSVGAQVFTAPITMAVFGWFAPGGIVVSLVVSPLISIFFTVGTASIACTLMCPVLQEPLGAIINLLYTILVFPVHCFAQIPVLEF